MQKAWFYEEHGPKEVLKLGEFPLPALRPDQLLVRVHAAALNPIDFKRRQSPAFLDEFPAIPGCDMAGVVVDKGPSVSKFNIGDEVYGNIQDFDSEGKWKKYGTLAQHVAVEENLVAPKPPSLPFEEAASITVVAQTAVEGFRNGGYRPGQSVFVVGGAGGVGSLVVQLAKRCYRASRVGASCSAKKVEFVRGLGADVVVDYSATRYEEVAERFDFVFDTVGDSNYSAVLAKEGAPVVDISWPPTNERAIFSGLMVSGGVLEELRPFLESGKLKAVIDPSGPYRFEDVIKAFEYLETGRAWGKVVISPFPSHASSEDAPKVPE